MKNLLKKEIWHDLFELTVFIEGIYGLMETVAGFSLMLVSERMLTRVFVFFARKALLEKPRDPLFNYIYLSFQSISADTKFLIALYILTNGLIKIFLALALYKEKLWAYNVAIWFIIFFTAYLCYRFIYHHSWLLIGLIFFDLLFILIIRNEHKIRVRRKIKREQASA